MDCDVASYDNVDAAQHHMKNNYMRNPPAMEIFNEEVCNLLKRKIKSTLSHMNALTIDFDYEGEVTGADACEILDKIAALHRRRRRPRSSSER